VPKRACARGTDSPGEAITLDRIAPRIGAAGEKLHIKVLGLTSIAPDVSPELALATIESITVLGALHATKEIKSALADRIR
jgi:hypothetical protein